ncbi:MAG TPA: type I 3-dehydroquinate dehydratase [Feifaniaceae bacterium]|nr:type I 3-dehydroquinate dehydratase [Feifaniaceae bacterium]
MKACVQIRGLTVGEGLPKIIVPVLAETMEELLLQAAALKNEPADAVEWRADKFGAVLDEAAAVRALKALRETIGDMPLLFTLRTKSEGGSFDAPREEYLRLNILAAASGLADIIDVEFGAGDAAKVRHIRELQARGVRVAASSHDFHRTPPKEEIVARLCAMQRAGADLVKIAVMPGNERDVLTLLLAAEEFTRAYKDRPLIAVSMGALGAVSRVCGNLSGSDMTFGAAGALSAPGQLPAKTLRDMLDSLNWAR